MKQNITLRLDKDLIKRGKVIASKKDTSLNRLLSDFLKQIVDEEDYYEQCKRKALNILDKGYHLGGKITYTREELHER
jgi:predicted transcriptional regulator